ncbi:efflux transporter [Wolfiporia cocos MD-104 SS10]|uniref:Efflux transporter n=1 Tax=Wolfiporia cocos (strain MD-104) TaxID=742152 RepID=A0A2H3JVT7_WOLCO|nr:efflux transporter [Wolfiporia cocos MD-104 SS10]
MAPAPEDAEQQQESMTVHADQHVYRPMSKMRTFALIATCTTAMILNASNSTSVSIALPTIGRDLNIPQYRLQWLISAYSLSSGCLLLFFGRLADLYGRKKAFLLGTFLLGIFGLGCGFANNEIAIDVLRGFHGLGAAASIPAALGILAHSIPPSRTRSVAFSTFGAGAPVGAAIGSAIGGVLTEVTKPKWRSMFFFQAGLSALVFLGGLLSFDADLPSTEKDRHVDWLGAFLVTASLVLLIFILSDGSIAPNGWKTGYIIGLLVAGVILLLAYVAWERFLEMCQDALLEPEPSTPSGSTTEKCDPERALPQPVPPTWNPVRKVETRLQEYAVRHAGKWWTSPPLMKVSLWGRAQGKLGVALVLALLTYCTFTSFIFWIQLYYQDYIGLDPVLTMVRMLPMFVTGVICTGIVALVVGHVPLVFLVGFGLSLTATANLLFALIDTTAPYWAFGFPAAVISVFGVDFVFASGTLFVAKVCLPHEQSVGGAIFQTMTQFGTALGLAITTIVYDSQLTKVSLEHGVVVNINGTNAPASAQLAGYRGALWTGFAIGALGAVLAIVFLRGAGIIGHTKRANRDNSA